MIFLLNYIHKTDKLKRAVCSQLFPVFFSSTQSVMKILNVKLELFCFVLNTKNLTSGGLILYIDSILQILHNQTKILASIDAFENTKIVKEKIFLSIICVICNILIQRVFGIVVFTIGEKKFKVNNFKLFSDDPIR